MDNNFVNIDDLVRQRLGGGQEPERSGAWSRMEQLLDKEDRRKPLGLYWKRAMSYCGVAMLLAAVSVGGYEMTSAFRAQGDAAVNPAGNSSVTTSNNTDRVAGSSSAVKNTIVSNTGNAVTAANTHSSTHTTAKNVVATENNVHNSGAHNTTSATQSSHLAANSSATGNEGHNDHIFAASGTSANKHNSEHTFVDDVNKNRANMIAAANTTATHHDRTNAIDNSTIKTSVANKGDNHVIARKSTGNSIATTVPENPAAPVFPKSDHIIDHGHGSAYVSQVKQLPLAAAAGKNNVGVPFKPAAVTPVLAHNVATTVPHTPMVVKPIAGKKVLQRIVMQEKRTGTYQGRSETRLDTISIDRITQELARIKESNDAARSATASTAPTNKSGNNNAATPANGVHTTAGKSGNSNKGNQPSATNNYAAKQGSVAGTPAIASADKVAQTNNGTLATNAEYNAAVQNGSDNLAAAQSGDIQASTDITPNAAPSAPASTPPPAENKPAVTKKKHGVNMAESLSNMFNEVKYKLGGAQFGTGLTAGINGTFFGPNSFKGFQFGITGAFELDDNWSFMAELKYFHRMNNDYSMDVTYNKYRPTTGGYFKDSTMVSYSFSTLHSFELPLTMRYTAARFSFFLGGNFLYTFAVNTGGAEQLVDPNVMPVVASNTANTAPAIKESDFGARFGVGYTCGIAYRVAPNVLLDFRNVQTVWDNAKATGSQAVSNQLYKSPSLQFSLFYRLGAGKNNKD